MRISIMKDDPGYQALQGFRKVKRVTLDGKQVLAATADEERGYIEEIVVDPDTGQFALCPHTGNVLTRNVTGKVVIELADVGARDWDENRKPNITKVQVGTDKMNGDLLVQVYSVVRPGAIRQMRLPKIERSSGATLCQQAGLLAGSAAEHLCDKFNDTLEPSECARVAVEECAKMIGMRT